MTAHGLIIAAPQSSAGKTTVTLALVAALRRRGLKVSAAKAGPDYIDPAFHAAASGSAAINLDSWAMPQALLDTLAVRAADSADMFVIEGVMGLFDGAPAKAGRCGATADLHLRIMGDKAAQERRCGLRLPRDIDDQQDWKDETGDKVGSRASPACGGIDPIEQAHDAFDHEHIGARSGLDY